MKSEHVRMVKANFPTTWSQSMDWERNSPYYDNYHSQDIRQKCAAVGGAVRQQEEIQFKNQCLEGEKQCV